MIGRHETQVLILGGGVAGLSIALRLSGTGRKITVIAKRDLTEGSSRYAQGGIAAVMDAADSVDSHVDDTLRAGAGLCRESTVRFITEHARESIEWLLEQGAAFTTEDDAGLHLTQEGGHSQRRIVHASDATGAEVMRALEARVRAADDIEVRDDCIAIDLVTSNKLGIPGRNRVLGAYALNKNEGHVETLTASTVVLATGGASKVYLYTSNPDTSTGDGVAMAWRAGCRIANMEFVQFHPTCLYHPQAKSFLVSEAVRGEGGELVLEDGTRFMAEHDERAELAPRDIVARAIDYEMKRRGDDCVYLDMTHESADFLLERFPNIHARCLDYGIDLTTAPIPVVPAAHYLCGGVWVDEKGGTTVDGLWAVGEVTCTGLHGANRLASNSLLEGLVYGHRTAISAKSALTDAPAPASLRVPDWDVGEAVASDEAVVVSQNWDEIRRFMWNYVGIVRTDRRLSRASRRIGMLQEEIREYYWAHLVNRDMLELRNIADVAELIIRCATARKESRGLHYNLDYPHPGEEWRGDSRVSKHTAPHIVHE